MKSSTVLVLVLGAGVLGVGSWWLFFRRPSNNIAPPVAAAAQPTLGPPWLGQFVGGLGQSLPDIGKAAGGAMDFLNGLQARKG